MLSRDLKTSVSRDRNRRPVWQLSRCPILVVAFLLALFSTNCRMTEKTEPPTRPAQDVSGNNNAIAIHRRALAIDMHADTTQRLVDEHVDLGQRLPDGHFDSVRAREGGLDAQF